MKQRAESPGGWRRSRSWRWLKRVWLMFSLLSMVALIFHQALLRHALDWGARHYAKDAGYQLDWSVEGDMRSGVTLRNVKLKGSPGDPIKSIEWRDASANYDLWDLATKGMGSFLKGVNLSDADIVIDAREFSKADKTKPDKVGGIGDYWLAHLHLRNINARIVTARGDIIVRGLTLLLDENSTGELSIDEITVEATQLHLKGVRAATEVKDRQVILTDLRLDEQVRIPRLALDFQEIKRGDIAYEIDARSGEAEVDSSGWIKHLGGDLTVDASATVNRLAHTEISRWVRLPPNVAWRVERADVKWNGRLDDPRGLAVDLTIDGGQGRFWNVTSDQLRARASLANGALQLHSLELHSGANSMEISASAMLPATWSEFAQISGDLRWKLSAPELSAIYDAAPKITGNLNGFGSVTLQRGRITGTEATLHGARLEVFEVPIAALDASVTTDMQAIQLKKIAIQLDDRNRAEISGSVTLAENPTASLSWELKSSAIDSLARLARWKMAPPPESGELAARGTARMNWAEIKKRDFGRLLADGTAQLRHVVWKKAPLDLADLEFSCRDGHADVKKLAIRFNDRNHADLKGRVKLDNTGEFEGEAAGTFEKLADLSGWFELAGMPAVKDGRAVLAWKGQGRTASREIKGTGSLQVSNLKFAGGTDAISGVLETQHHGTRAEISRLEATAGKFRAEAKASLSETRLEVSRISLSADRTPLVEGALDVPLAFGQASRPALPIDPDRPIEAHLSMEKLELKRLFGIWGQTPPLSGIIHGNLEVHGKLPEVGGRVSLAMSNVRVEAAQGKLDPATVRLEATLAKDHLNVSATADQKPLRNFTAEADLPLDIEKWVRNPKGILESPVSGRIVLPDSNLDVVQRFVPTLAGIHGTGGVDVQFEGPLRAPQWEGTIHADASSAALKDVRMDIKDLKARLSFAGQRVTLDDVSVMLAGGQMRLGGTVELTDLSNPLLDLRLEAKQALIVRDDTMSMRADGVVSAKGSFKNAAVTGRMELVRGRIFKEIEFLPLSLPNQLPPPPPRVRAVDNTPSLPALFDQWTFDVDIATRDSVRLLGNVLNGGAVAGLHAGGTGAAPELEGKVSLEGARIRLPFSRLEVSRGELIFSKDKPWEPEIDLQGDSRVGNYLVTVYAYGSAYHPQIRFTSSPPLKENEIATLLATGSASGDARTASDEAANRVAFLLFSKMYRKLFHKESPKRYDEEPPKLTFSFSPLSSGSTQRNVTATYEISPNYHLVASAGERGFRGMLYYLVRFR